MKGNIWLVPKAVILLKESNLFSGWMSTPPWVQGHGRQMTTSPLIWKPCSLPHSPPSHSCLAKKNVFPKKKFSKMLLCWPTLRFILVSSLCLVPLFKKKKLCCSFVLPSLLPLHLEWMCTEVFVCTLQNSQSPSSFSPEHCWVRCRQISLLF